MQLSHSPPAPGIGRQTKSAVKMLVSPTIQFLDINWIVPIKALPVSRGICVVIGDNSIVLLSVENTKCLEFQVELAFIGLAKNGLRPVIGGVIHRDFTLF